MNNNIKLDRQDQRLNGRWRGNIKMKRKAHHPYPTASRTTKTRREKTGNRRIKLKDSYTIKEKTQKTTHNARHDD